MKYLISLPQNIADNFHELTGLPKSDWFASSDPETGYLGSGGGTVNLLLSAYKHELEETPSLPAGRAGVGTFADWLASEKRIIIHAGGQSRRLPAYGPTGKILTPMPVLRWKKGQRLNQTLLDLQLPLLEKILDKLPDGMNTLIASGDVLIRATGSLPEIPNKDVVAFGHWVNPELASRHGVFFCDRFGKNEFEFMLQKPEPQEIKELLPDHLFMIDVGIWGMSDGAVDVLFEKSGIKTKTVLGTGYSVLGEVRSYDLYGDFGLELGNKPSAENRVPNTLSSAVLPLPNGEFYHFGTSKELISSNLELQNKVQDQREIIHRQIKPHPAVFIQNSITEMKLTADNENIWIENSHLGKGWKLTKNHIITGVPENDWVIDVPEDSCIDIVPLSDDKLAIRVYGFNEKFQGEEQTKLRFPVVTSEELTQEFFASVLNSFSDNCDLKTENSFFVSASELLQKANLKRVFAQRNKNRVDVLPALAKNFRHSIFYHLDLEALAEDWCEAGYELPAKLPEGAPQMTRIHHSMFCSKVEKLNGSNVEELEKNAFQLLQEAIIGGLKLEKVNPKISVHSDQVVWGRSPVRLDLGGGWTDTPPNCILNGGKVVNIAVELNGQAPLQVFIKPTKELKIILRSIDLGVREEITSFEELENFQVVGGAFSIPKAALSLSGISRYSALRLRSGTSEDSSNLRPFDPVSSPGQALSTLMEELGGGLEISMLVAVPKGSGLGTSSILASTVLGSLSDFYGLGWSRSEIGRRTLALEQMLTTGGGWQDQFGGIYSGLKMLETKAGFDQTPEVSWLPGNFFTDSEKRSCLLLYYTGITRVAKDILGEIVRGMFLNSNHRLQILEELEQHAEDLKDNLLKQDWAKFGSLIDKSWRLNQALDNGTNPPEVQGIIDKIFYFMAGQKLLGAGGGGYMFIVAKNPASTIRIKEVLQADPPNDRARFVDFKISEEGLVVTRS